MTSHRRPARMRYRVTVTEIIDGQPTTVMDARGNGFHAIVGDIKTTGYLQAEHGKGGPHNLREHLANLITDNPT
jgi:hypothetical protein